MSVHRVDQGMAVAAARAIPQEVGKELRSRYRQLRVMLHTAGLAATYAFITSKARDADEDALAGAYQKVAVAIGDLLADLGVLDRGTTSPRDVLARLGELDSADYARASAEVSAFAGWLSRLGDALCRERNGNA